jgi:hypothetical protein
MPSGRGQELAQLGAAIVQPLSSDVHASSPSTEIERTADYRALPSPPTPVMELEPNDRIPAGWDPRVIGTVETDLPALSEPAIAPDLPHCCVGTGWFGPENSAGQLQHRYCDFLLNYKCLLA